MTRRRKFPGHTRAKTRTRACYQYVPTIQRHDGTAGR
jgi:hypothetical protein